MLTKEQINLIVSYVTVKPKSENNQINGSNVDVFSIDDRINQQLDGYKQSNVQCVAIGDRGLMPVNNENFNKSKEFTDMINICNSCIKPKIKVKTLKKSNC